MKLAETLDELNACSSGRVILTYEARRLLIAVANRLLAQRKILIGLLVAAVGYGITLTLIATEVINENQKLTYDLNVSQTVFMIQSSLIKTRGLCLPRLEMR